MPRYVKIDLTGQSFHRLTAMEFLPDDSGYSKYRWRCECGVEKTINSQAVIRGFTKSCGCYQKDGLNSRKTHGQSGSGRTKTYNSWAGMMTRGEWGGHPSFEIYGAVGIRVDARWHDFVNFLDDMGERPTGTSIDRIDNTKGYFPGNCRWATRLQQALNKSNTVKVKYRGEVVAVYNLCDQLGLSKPAVRARALRRGNNYADAFRSFGIDMDHATAAARNVNLNYTDQQ